MERGRNTKAVIDSALGFVELSSEDPPRTRKFLEVAFGWRFQERSMPQGRYLSFELSGGGAGGIRPTRPTESPSTLSYLRVPDLAVALKAVEEAGGSIVLPRVDVPAMGSFFGSRFRVGRYWLAGKTRRPGRQIRRSSNVGSKGRRGGLSGGNAEG
jgi:predicted enzyme related to lactoylglutathione lyase